MGVVHVSCDPTMSTLLIWLHLPTGLRVEIGFVGFNLKSSKNSTLFKERNILKWKKEWHKKTTVTYSKVIQKRCFDDLKFKIRTKFMSHPFPTVSLKRIRSLQWVFTILVPYSSYDIFISPPCLIKFYSFRPFPMNSLPSKLEPESLKSTWVVNVLPTQTVFLPDSMSLPLQILLSWTDTNLSHPPIHSYLLYSSISGLTPTWFFVDSLIHFPSPVREFLCQRVLFSFESKIN